MIYYVDKVLGNDGTAVPDNPLLPYQFPKSASDAAIATVGSHTVMLTDTSYVGTEIGANQYWLWGAGGLADTITVKPEVAGTSLAPTVTTGLLRFPTAAGNDGKTYEFEDLTIGRVLGTDGGVDPNYLFDFIVVTGAPVNFNFTRCNFYDALFYQNRIDVAGLQVNLKYKDCQSFAQRITNTRSFIRGTSIGAGGVSIDGLVLHWDLFDANNHGVIYLEADSLGVTSNIKNVSGVLATNPASVVANGLIFGIRIANMDDTIVDNINVALHDHSPSSTWGCYGILTFCNDAALTANRQTISNSNINMEGFDGANGAGFGIAVGGDVGGRIPNKSPGSKIISCSVTGDSVSVASNLHGIGIVGEDDCDIIGCVSTLTDIGYLLKLTSNCRAIGNLSLKCGLGGVSNMSFYSKGGTNDEWINNTSIHDIDSDSRALLVGSDPTLPTNSTGIRFFGNHISIQTATSQKIIEVTTLQTATFDYNYYTVIGAIPANAFDYAGTVYTTVAEWLTAREPNGVDLGTTDPLIDIANGNYKPKVGSALVGVTNKLWTGNIPRPHGIDGEPFSDTNCDISCVMTTYDPNHPANL